MTLQGRTIAAISTAYGESGIGIVRMSGPDALAIGKAVFCFASKNAKPEENPRHMYFGRVTEGEGGKTIDEALFVYMKAPNTYTGEDVVEIQCHGSLASLKNVLSALLSCGAEPAERGEFTKLAFLNGRLDLAQAEAVIDVIKARTEKSLDTAVLQMEGKLSEKIKEIRADLLELLVLITVNMDYPDEDTEEATYEKVLSAIEKAESEIKGLLEGASEGKILREGLSVAIVGKPNVGKSSLMNAFLGESRSIVTNIPGTTRDTIEEQFSLRGIPIRITDTAGIRDTEDVVEAIGTQRSRKAIEVADLILLVLDASIPLSAEDRDIISYCEGRPCVVILNKTDLPAVIREVDILNLFKPLKIEHASLLNYASVELLKDDLEALISGGNIRGGSEVLVSNARHIRLLEKALEGLQEASLLTRSVEALDLIEISVQSAFSDLGEITGETASSEIIDAVFERFCLGK